MDEVSRERNDALNQNEETWKENRRVAIQLAEVLRLNEIAVRQKDARILEALSELEFENIRQLHVRVLQDLFLHICSPL